MEKFEYVIFNLQELLKVSPLFIYVEFFKISKFIS